MKLLYPVLELDLNKLEHNAAIITSYIKDLGGICFAVTKVVGSSIPVARRILASGADGLGESRISNIEKLRQAGIDAPILLLRSPALSEIDSVVRLTDISLNSELVVLDALNERAEYYDKQHQVILMTDLGDGREGVAPAKLKSLVDYTRQLTNISIYGIGVNLACFSGVLPTDTHMNQLIELKSQLSNNKNILVSGGNSSGLHWLFNTNQELNWVKAINHWRIGESIFLGWDIITQAPIPECRQDVCKLRTEVIEVQTKAVHDSNMSTSTRVIAALGLEEIGAGQVFPLDHKLKIIGVSSDHLVALLAPGHKIEVGDIVDFRMDYQGLSAAANSRHVTIKYL